MDDKQHSNVVLLSEWTELTPESLAAAPCLLEQTLCQPTDEQPQLAKDVPYAQAVLEAWKQEEQNSDHVWEAEWCQCKYSSTNGQAVTTPLYGHLIRKPSRQAHTKSPPSGAPGGIVLFHTGAGPHDLFLLYKAAALVNHPWKTTKTAATANHDHSDGGGDVLVLVADILSDDTGWAWNPDRTRYNQVRTKILGVDRTQLSQRVQAAIETVQTIGSGSDNGNDNTEALHHSPRLAALGWCLGGHSVLEVAKLQHPFIRAMATFHGVFDGATTTTTTTTTTNPNDDEVNAGSSTGNVVATNAAATAAATEVLICNGVLDPFVPHESLEGALALLQELQYHRTSLLQLSNAKHGFTNPAQDFNDNPAFAYNAEAAQKAWTQTLRMLERTLFTT